jgi:hypothetical protein
MNPERESADRSSKRGDFQASAKVRFSPRFTTNPPRFHHQKTTFRTSFFAKSPTKTPLHHAAFFPVTIRKHA